MSAVAAIHGIRQLPRPCARCSLGSIRLKGTLSKTADYNVYSESKTLPYTQQQLYQVIADIDSYSTFIPFLSGSRVLSILPGTTNPHPSDAHHSNTKPWLVKGKQDEQVDLEAELQIGFLGFEEAYISRVHTRKWSLVTATADCPSLFKHLSTQWELSPSPISSGTLVAFHLNYEFSNPIYALAAGQVFEDVSAKVMKGFEKRCLALYG